VFGILPPEKAGENVVDSPQSEPQSPNELPTGSLKKPLRAYFPAPSSRISHVTPRLSALPAPTEPLPVRPHPAPGEPHPGADPATPGREPPRPQHRAPGRPGPGERRAADRRELRRRPDPAPGRSRPPQRAAVSRRTGRDARAAGAGPAPAATGGARRHLAQGAQAAVPESGAGGPAAPVSAGGADLALPAAQGAHGRRVGHPRSHHGNPRAAGAAAALRRPAGALRGADRGPDRRHGRADLPPQLRGPRMIHVSSPP